MAIANAPRKLSEAGRGDFGDGEISRVDNDIVVTETMKLNKLWRHRVYPRKN
jgi:hypothetical protein